MNIINEKIIIFDLSGTSKFVVLDIKSSVDTVLVDLMLSAVDQAATTPTLTCAVEENTWLRNWAGNMQLAVV